MLKQRETETCRSANMLAFLGGLGIFTFELLIRYGALEQASASVTVLCAMNVASIFFILLYAFIEENIGKVFHGAILMLLGLIIVHFTGTKWLFGEEIIRLEQPTGVVSIIPVGFLMMVVLDCLKKAVYLLYGYLKMSEAEFEKHQLELTEAYVCTVALGVAMVCHFLL